MAGGVHANCICLPGSILRRLGLWFETANRSGPAEDFGHEPDTPGSQLRHRSREGGVAASQLIDPLGRHTQEFSHLGDARQVEVHGARLGPWRSPTLLLRLVITKQCVAPAVR